MYAAASSDDVESMRAAMSEAAGKLAVLHQARQRKQFAGSDDTVVDADFQEAV